MTSSPGFRGGKEGNPGIAGNLHGGNRRGKWSSSSGGKQHNMSAGNSQSCRSKELFDYVLCVASGRKVKAEEAGFHDMAIFKQGVTL